MTRRQRVSGRRLPGLGFFASLCLLAMAVTIRALVPAGYMPDERAGVFELVVCSADGRLQTVSVDAEGRPVDDAGDHADRMEVCAFAGFTHAPAPDEPVVGGGAADWRPAPTVVAAVGSPLSPEGLGAPPSARGPPPHMT